MGQPIVHLEIMGKDAVKLQKFYADLFGWKVGEPMAEMGFYAMVDAESAGIGGGIGTEGPEGHTRVTAYVQVPDLQATLDSAVQMGGKVVMPPQTIPGGPKLAQFTDPDGNLMGLLEG